MARQSMPVAKAMSGRVLVDAYKRAPQMLWKFHRIPDPPSVPTIRGAATNA